MKYTILDCRWKDWSPLIPLTLKKLMIGKYYVLHKGRLPSYSRLRFDEKYYLRIIARKVRPLVHVVSIYPEVFEGRNRINRRVNQGRK